MLRNLIEVRSEASNQILAAISCSGHPERGGRLLKLDISLRININSCIGLTTLRAWEGMLASASNNICIINAINCWALRLRGVATNFIFRPRIKSGRIRGGGTGREAFNCEQVGVRVQFSFLFRGIIFSCDLICLLRRLIIKNTLHRDGEEFLLMLGNEKNSFRRGWFEPEN